MILYRTYQQCDVATALTVYGIETAFCDGANSGTRFVATALTVYGIETVSTRDVCSASHSVATALTVYGIETQVLLQTFFLDRQGCNSSYRLRY